MLHPHQWGTLGTKNCYVQNFSIGTKKKQVVEKVVEWIKENCYGKNYLDWYDWDQVRIDTDDLIYDIKEYMEVSI